MTLNFKLMNFRKLPLILQEEQAECGHACLAMISNFWGHRLDLYTLRKMSNPSKRGTSLLELRNLCEELGFSARALRIAPSELKEVRCPAILHWNMNHFVVLKKVSRHHIVIHDPAFGNRRCTFEEASQRFTGIVLEIEKQISFVRKKSNRKKLKLFELIKASQGVKKYLIYLLLVSFVIEILNLFHPLFMQYITDHVISFQDETNFKLIASGFFLLIVLHAFSELIRGNMVIYLTNNLTEQFAANVVKHLLKLPLDFFEKRGKSDIYAKFQSIEQIQRKVSIDFINTLLDSFFLLIHLGIMLFYSRVLTGLVTLSLTICLSLRFLSYHVIKKQTQSSLHQQAKTTAIFLENLQSILAIKSFMKESMRFNHWRNHFISFLNANIKISKIQTIYQVSNQFLFNFDLIVLVGIGAHLILKNNFSLGMLMAFLSYRLLLINKASSLFQSVFDYKLISIQLQRLSDIVLHHPEEITSKKIISVPELKKAITVQNMSFRYHENEAYIFTEINLEIQAGEKIALIGPSGCGKTTLLKLMMGLLQPTSGKILIDDHPLFDFGLKNYRQIIAAVMQEDSLINGSILDNIAFFDDCIDFDKVAKVTNLACIDQCISRLPMGYETLLGEIGSGLSGGQKQRLLLARALYKSPQILFLDEATSHLDTAQEQLINQALKTLNMTQIIIAHREETIRMADRVIDLACSGTSKTFQLD